MKKKFKMIRWKVDQDFFNFIDELSGATKRSKPKKKLTKQKVKAGLYLVPNKNLNVDL